IRDGHVTGVQACALPICAASTARSRPAASSTSFTRSSERMPMASAALRLDTAAAEVALGEAQAVLALVQDTERRGRLADLVAARSEERRVGKQRSARWET